MASPIGPKIDKNRPKVDPRAPKGPQEAPRALQERLLAFFDRFLVDFGDHFGIKIDKKSYQKSIKFWLQFFIDFWYQKSPQNRLKIDPKALSQKKAIYLDFAHPYSTF